MHHEWRLHLKNLGESHPCIKTNSVFVGLQKANFNPDYVSRATGIVKQCSIIWHKNNSAKVVFWGGGCHNIIVIN